MRRLFLFLTLILILTLIYFRFPLSLGIDPTMYLQVGTLLLQGQRPYIDFIDINPPLIFYLNVIPALISQWTSIQIIIVFKILLILFIAAMSYCLWRLLKRNAALEKHEATLLTAIFILISAAQVVSRSQGQREHLFMLVFVPYLFLRLQRLQQHFSETRNFSAGVGFICGTMACLKPHFLALVLAVELLVWCYKKGVSCHKQPELAAFLVPCLLYGAHFLFLPADIQHAFFFDHIPLITAHYDSFTKTFAELFGKEWPLFVLSSTGIGVLFFLPTESIERKRLQQTLGLTGFLALLLYVYQKKGWSYHYVPICYPLTFAQLFILASARKFRIGFTSLFLYLLTFASFCFFAVSSSTCVRGYIDPSYILTTETYGIYDVKDIMSRNTKPQDRVLLVTPCPMYAYPSLVQLGLLPGSRYLFLFPVSFFNNPHLVDASKPFHYKTLDEMPAAEADFVRKFKAELIQAPPQLLIFIMYKNEWDFLPDNFNIFDYFVTNGVWDSIRIKYTQVYHSKDVYAFKLLP